MASPNIPELHFSPQIYSGAKTTQAQQCISRKSRRKTVIGCRAFTNILFGFIVILKLHL